MRSRRECPWATIPNLPATCATSYPDCRTNRTTSSWYAAVYAPRGFTLILLSDFMVRLQPDVSVKSREVMKLLIPILK